MKSKELRQKRKKALEDARALLDRAEGENRSLTSEEQEQYDRMWAEAESLRKDLERVEQLEEAERQLRDVPDPETRGGDTQPGDRGPEGGGTGGEDRERVTREEQEYRDAFDAFLRCQQITARHAELFEQRALSVGVSTEGGEMVPTEQFREGLIKFVDDIVYLRQWATIIPLGAAQSLGQASLDADPADSDWTTELQTGNEDSAMAFGKRTMTPNPLAKRIKVSRRLLRLASNTEEIVRSRLGYKFGVSQEKGFLTGDGNNKPLGLFVASASGIPTSRDVSEGNTATEISFDGLIAAKFFLKGQYWPRARWLFHRDAMKNIAKLKDGNGQYIWRESTRVGEPDRILGLPAFMSEFVPNTFTTGQYVGMVADFSWYYIAEQLSMTIQRLDELYAETNQVGFIGRLELDGAPVLAEAFARVKLA